MRTASRRKRGRQRIGKRSRSPRGQVFLTEPAFIVLVAAATEAYKRECYGVLLGERRHGRIYIRVAFAYQTARRTPTSVKLVRGRRRIIRSVLKAFPRYEYIGEFHSHPGRGEEPGSLSLSAEDIVGVHAGDCELVISVRRSRSYLPWMHCLDGSLSGVAGRYFLKLRAYLAEESSRGRVRGRVTTIKCEYAVTTANSQRLLDKRRSTSGP